MQNRDAKTAAHGLVENWVTKFGCPVNLHSDNRTKFMSDLFTEMCNILAIERILTTSLHLEGVSMIESMEESLSKFNSDHQIDWDCYLQLVLMAYGSSVHTVSENSPNY